MSATPTAGGIHAILGPTNTGKTHRAIARMLEHETGMIGFPLRLLAREVYDRVRKQVGDEAVALVTGEEKIVPRGARYFVATVEAMPVSRAVQFLAVDEIQLAGNDQRGHLFTERLLDARGTQETWFLGSDAMRGALAEIVPTAQIATYPRLSKLSFAGGENLPKVPARSAIVAFSLPEVYALAERVRARRGGAAIVAGALSPRTRNAQVALFQNGDVDYLVATDAIGMGLNLDVRHVAFASTRKFDGREVRGLEDTEVAQIAGRAGRHHQDGTFGTLNPAALSADTIAAVELHRFPQIRRLYWRNSDLDFSSTFALMESLRVPPRIQRFRPAPLADDLAALEKLVASDGSYARLRGDALKLLWDVCKIPDFRKLLFENHVQFLAELFTELRAHHGVVRNDWISARVAPLNDVSGTVDDLTARIAETRLFTYLANHESADGSSWLPDAAAWRAHTTALEDRLSDALHEALVRRFVDETKKRPVRTGNAAPAPRRPRGTGEDLLARVAPTHPFAALAKLRGAMTPEPPAVAALPPLAERLAARLGAGMPIPARASAPLLWDFTIAGEPLGRLRPGKTLVTPRVRPIENALGPDDLRRSEGLLEGAVAVSLVQALGVSCMDLPTDDAALRGARFALRQGLGFARSRGLAAEMAGVRKGLRWWSIAETDPRLAEWRAALWETFVGVPFPKVGRGDARAVAEVDGPNRCPPPLWEAIGYARAGAWALPILHAEALLEALAAGDRSRAERLAREAGIPARDVAPFVDDLRDDVI